MNGLLLSSHPSVFQIWRVCACTCSTVIEQVTCAVPPVSSWVGVLSAPGETPIIVPRGTFYIHSKTTIRCIWRCFPTMSLGCWCILPRSLVGQEGPSCVSRLRGKLDEALTQDTKFLANVQNNLEVDTPFFVKDCRSSHSSQVEICFDGKYSKIHGVLFQHGNKKTPWLFWLFLLVFRGVL